MANRINDIVRALRPHGEFELVRPKGGSHYKIVGPDGQKFSFSLHKGAKTAIPLEFIQAMCDYFGVDESEFKLTKQSARQAAK